MDWSDLKGIVGSAAPILGTLVGGPAGALIGTILSSALGTANTPDAVNAALAGNPQAIVTVQQIAATHAEKLQELAIEGEKNRLQAETANTTVVNQTMQAETKSDHWATWFWRPAIGLAVAIDVVITSVTVGAAYVGVVFCGVKPESLSYIPAMLGAMSALIGVTMPVLGIASYFRGKAQADPNIPTDNRG